MRVDVPVSTEILRARDDVSAFAGDPSNVCRWYAKIQSVEWKTEPSVRVGARAAFVASFLGRRLSYTYEISEWIPG
jgi:hypothetical protein